MTIYDFGDHFMAHIEWDHWHRRNTSAIKEFKGTRWIPTQKMWWVSGLYRDRVLLLQKSHRAEILPGAAANVVPIVEFEPLPELEFEPPVQNIELRHYQKQGVAQGLRFRRFINGDEQGLGKTIQTITTVASWNMLGDVVFPALVICPASLKENWKREIEKFTNHKAIILSDKSKQNWPQYHKLNLAQFFITNYESLRKFFVHKMPEGKGIKSGDIVMNPNIDLFRTIIIDEAHRCKDTGTQQTKLCLRIARKKENCILLTGTPIVNKPLDLWPQLCIMGQESHFALREKQFKDRFCDGGRGASNLKALNSLLNKHCFFRREKKDVAKDLPEKSRQQILCDITTLNEYVLAERNFTSWLMSNDFDDEAIQTKMKAEILTQMNVLRQISARGKIPAAREFIDEVMDAGEKLIVFVVLREIVDELKKHYPHAVTITGSDDTQSRQRNIDAFQTDPNCKLIICNIKAAGVGITLTASSRVLFIEYPWTYADCVQCEDRAHRIGQVWPVMCTYLLGENTIDDKLLELILAKKDLAMQITGATDAMEMSVIDSMMKLLRK